MDIFVFIEGIGFIEPPSRLIKALESLSENNPYVYLSRSPKEDVLGPISIYHITPSGNLHIRGYTKYAVQYNMDSGRRRLILYGRDYQIDSVENHVSKLGSGLKKAVDESFLKLKKEYEGPHENIVTMETKIKVKYFNFLRSDYPFVIKPRYGD